MSKINIEELNRYAKSFTEGTRTTGENYVYCTDTKYQDLNLSLHGHRSPDDWQYKLIARCADDLTKFDYDEEEDITDLFSTSASDLAPMHYHEILSWLSANLENINLVEDYVKDYGIDSDHFDLLNTASQALTLEIERILHEIYNYFLEEDSDEEE